LLPFRNQPPPQRARLGWPILGIHAGSARRLFEETFSQRDVQVEGFGNVLTARSFLYGISAGELSGEELAYSELGYEVIVAVRARKAVESQ
jgi:hypothetical protein